VSSGFDWPACRGLQGFTPLHYAASRGHAAVVSELLRGWPGMVSTTNDAGETALHLAAYSGNLLLLEQLLDRGAPINAVNSEGEAALAYAARKGQAAAVRLLLRRGADERIKDQYGEVAEEYAEDAATLRAFGGGIMSRDKDKDKDKDEDKDKDKDKGEVEDEEGRSRQGAQRAAGAAGGRLPIAQVTHILRFLAAADVCRAACVCALWHGAGEDASLWAKLGVRRWETALEGVLGGVGCAIVASASSSSGSGSSGSGSGSSGSSSRKNSKTHIAVLESRAQELEERLEKGC